jgi:hypothetical protein
MVPVLFSLSGLSIIWVAENKMVVTVSVDRQRLVEESGEL